MIPEIINIDKDKILEEANNMKLYGYRFAALTCEKEGEEYELTYHFDLNYEIKNLRITVTPKDHIVSISSVYPSALLIENEYQDLYGFSFEGLLIDYKGRLYLAENGPTTPMLDKTEK